MAIDQIRHDREFVVAPEHRSYTTVIIVLLSAMALLAVGEFYMMGRLSALRGSLQSEQAKTRADLSARLDDQIAAIEHANSQELQGLRQELIASTQNVGKTQNELHRERALVAKLSKLQSKAEQAAELLRQQVAQKADSQQVGTLTQDVSTTKKDLDSLSKELGMARSELGTLIATNHSEIEQLRRMGERDYYEFSLAKNQEKRVAGVGLILKKTNPKHSQFSVVMLADDEKVEKNNRTINEPVLFSLRGSKQFYELVVNKVQSKLVTGYISAPKEAEMAER